MLVHGVNGSRGCSCSETCRLARCAMAARSESLFLDVWSGCHCMPALKWLHSSRYCPEARQVVQEAEQQDLRCCGSVPQWLLRLSRSAGQLQVHLQEAG